MERDLMRLMITPDLPPIPSVEVNVRHPASTPDDVELLAQLMFDAYRGTVDFEPTDTIDVARDEVAETFSGDAGPFLVDASFLAVEGNDAVGASLVTRFEGSPLVAFTMTRARKKRQGLARALLLRSIHALADAGERQLDLEVSRENEPAVNLYRSLGFTVVEG